MATSMRQIPEGRTGRVNQLIHDHESAKHVMNAWARGDGVQIGTQAVTLVASQRGRHFAKVYLATENVADRHAVTVQIRFGPKLIDTRGVLNVKASIGDSGSLESWNGMVWRSTRERRYAKTQAMHITE